MKSTDFLLARLRALRRTAVRSVAESDARNTAIAVVYILSGVGVRIPIMKPQTGHCGRTPDSALRQSERFYPACRWECSHFKTAV